MNSMRLYKSPNGYILMYMLVFLGIFSLVTAGLLSFSSAYQGAASHKFSYEQSLHIAEAGIHYYRWHLAHAPTDFTNDVGIHDYRDPQGGIVGRFQLAVFAPEVGSSVVLIRSTGWTLLHPNTKRTVEARYGRKSLADFAYLSDANVWFGDTESLSGKLHSNGGIRMDGQGDSRMTSGVSTYICGHEHGCNREEKPGIWGTGGPQELWDFPVLPFDFDSITLDLESIEQSAVASGGYLGDSGDFGYHLFLNANGTYSVNTVTKLQPPAWGHDGSKWSRESRSIDEETPLAGYQNRAFPANKVLFLEDDIWIEGTVTDRITVVSARIPTGQGNFTNVVIPNSIVMPNRDGSDVLGIISQNNILVPLESPDTLQIDAALLAQNGHVFRDYYPAGNSEPYRTYALRDTIKTYGAIITKTVWTWSWVDASGGPVVSGYRNTETVYNPQLTFSPPPFWPQQEEYTFIDWGERPNP